MSPSPPHTPKPRGVFRAAWSGPNGEPILRARDSAGRTIAETTIVRGMDVEIERQLLWSFLNWRDPIADDRSGRFRV